eukprot:1348919-Rhodomonas_salina.3
MPAPAAILRWSGLASALMTVESLGAPYARTWYSERREIAFWLYGTRCSGGVEAYQESCTPLMSRLNANAYDM